MHPYRHRRGERFRGARVRYRRGSWVILPLSLLAWTAPSASAETVTTGLVVRGYNISQNAPPRVDGQIPDCQSNYSYIFDWPDVYMAGCRTNQVMLHYTGDIVVPTETASFLVYSDDGAWVDVGGNEFGYWGLRGCSATQSPVYTFSAGESLPFDAWFYEWGGGECFRLYWDIGNGWEIVPASAFTSAGTPPTTTTTTTTLAPYLNPPSSPAASAQGETEVLVSWNAPEPSNVEVERYAVFFSSDNFATGYAVSTTDTSIVVSNLEPGTQYQFRVRADNDTLSVYSNPSNIVEVATLQTTTTSTTTTTTTTTTTEVPTTWEESTTTSTTSSSVPTPSVDASTTTVPATTTVAPTTSPATVPVTRTTSTTTSSTTTTDAPAPTTLPPQTTVPDTTTTQPSTTTTLPPGGIAGLTPDDISSLSPEDVVSLLDSTPIATLGKEQLLAVVENAPLDDLPDEQLQEIFSSIDPSSLSAEEEQQLVAALNEADDDTKSLFEESVNVFADGLDTYVPSGSNVPVSTRRVIIAATTVVSTLTVASPPSSPSPSSPGGGGSGSGGPSGTGSEASGTESEPKTKRRRLFGGR